MPRKKNKRKALQAKKNAEKPTPARTVATPPLYPSYDGVSALFAAAILSISRKP